jgi:4-amino-4-deoxy-L-arabinose transferase-like glycosyltransferase
MENGAAPDRRWGWFLPTLLLATAALKLAAAAAYPGFQSGDDLEIVEAAARAGLGFPYEPWSIRSLFHPIVFVAPFLRLAGVLGLHGPRGLTWFATVPTVLFSTAGIALLWRLSQTLGWSAAAGRAAAFLFAVHWLPFAYASMPFPRPISTAFVLAAFVLVAREDAGDRAALAAGAAAAAAMVVRWSEGLLVAPLLVFTAWRTRRPVAVLSVLAGFAAALLLFAGVFDAQTRGSPFASLSAFVRYTQNPDAWGADDHGRPWFWYLSNLLGWAGPILVLLAAAGVRDRRSAAPLFVAASAVALLSYSPMKQPRYVQAAIPFLALAAALGWERLRTRRAWLGSAALVLAGVLGVERTLHLLRHKSMAAAAAAEALSSMPDPPHTVVLEQAWAFGDALAFPPGTAIRDLAPKRPLLPETVRAAAEGAGAVALYADDASGAVVEALGGRFRPCATVRIPESPDVVIFLPPGRPCAALLLDPKISAARSGS